MERRCFVLLLVFLTTFVRAQDNATTLEELFLDRYGASIHQVMSQAEKDFSKLVDRGTKSVLSPFVGKLKWLPLTLEIIRYFSAITFNVMFEFGSDLGKVRLDSILKDLNQHCAQYLKTPIENLTVVPSNATSCVGLLLTTRLTSKLKTAIVRGTGKLSRDCSRHLLDLCKVVHANCTRSYEERIVKLLVNYVQDANELVGVGSPRWTPLDVIRQYVIRSVPWVDSPYSTAYSILSILTFHISPAPSIEPLSYVNLVHPKSNEEVVDAFFKDNITTQSQEQLTWGIVRSRAGAKDHVCQRYKEIYPRGSERYRSLLYSCNYASVYKLTFDLLRCAYTDPSSKPLTWSTVRSAYFHSQCLCVAFQGAQCGVKGPGGVDPHHYCLSVLLRDFQRQISYRPAVTYFDYAFKTRVPVCQFTNFFQVGFRRTCEALEVTRSFSSTLSVQCYFKDLINKELNCSESLEVATYNATTLCLLQFFMEFVFCEGDADVEASVSYYVPGDSTLVHVLTYSDVAMRLVTLITYLVCPELRNLPGKILTGYQVTALIRLVAVRVSLVVDFSLAVSLDVTLDLSSTLWLTAFLHFLTTSIKTLRPPDSLTPYEAVMVLLRYALLGWVLPAALSAAFFLMDDFLDSRVQFGQLLFVLCNYAALIGNLYMFFYNSHFYYDVKKSAAALRPGVKTRSVFADLFNFALKTSVLSGAGITIRLIFTQIQGLEHLLGYYHAMGTFQGLLLFLLYGCNREAREFWQGVWSRTFRRRQNNSSLRLPPPFISPLSCT